MKVCIEYKKDMKCCYFSSLIVCSCLTDRLRTEQHTHVKKDNSEKDLGDHTARVIHFNFSINLERYINIGRDRQKGMKTEQCIGKRSLRERVYLR